MTKKALTKYVPILGLLIFSCTYSSSDVEKAGFITRLGNDTLAVESFKKTDSSMVVKALIRIPETRFLTYNLVQDERGGISDLVIKTHDPEEGFNSEGEFSRSYKKEGDSLVVDIKTNDGSIRTLKAKYEEGTLPFLEMIHWPFELAFNAAMKTDADSINQKLLAGSRTRDFVIAKIGEDTLTIRHPSRGVMGVKVNANGDIISLEASRTTRKLIVDRVSDVDIEKLGKQFYELDKQGKSFGAFSAAVEREFSFRNTDFMITHGSPKKRGRVLFGGIVPYGERWRTGADRATHFTTSRALTVEGLKVPAGEYTLFLIPEKDGGTLIINKQTGQNGRTYNEDRDLGRIPVSVSKKEDSTEEFTILIEETSAGGTLKLVWGNTVYTVDFTIG